MSITCTFFIESATSLLFPKHDSNPERKQWFPVVLFGELVRYNDNECGKRTEKQREQKPVHPASVFALSQTGIDQGKRSPADEELVFHLWQNLL